MTTTFVARHGRSAVTDANYGVHVTDEPDIVAHVDRRALLVVDWEITEGPYGRVLDRGQTCTKAGAKLKAIQAAHRPNILAAVGTCPIHGDLPVDGCTFCRKAGAS